MFDDFHGLGVIASSDGIGPEATCLYIVSQDGTVPMAVACSVAPVDPMTAVRVSARLPAELRERFADGTVLRFELDLESPQVRVSAVAGQPASTP